MLLAQRKLTLTVRVDFVVVEIDGNVFLLRDVILLFLIVVQFFLIFWLVYLFSVKRIVKRNLKSFKSRHLMDKLDRSRK